MPQEFAGGEGELCQGYVVRLASLNEVPALLEETIWGSNSIDKTVIHLTLKTNTGWARTCSITILAKRRYTVMDQFCDGNYCDALASIAPNLSDLRHANENGVDQPSNPSDLDLRGTKRDTFMNMVRIAEKQGIKQDFEIPTLGKKHVPSIYSDRTFVGWDTQLVPIVLDGHIFLGKIGTAGFGTHYGSADVLAVYKLSGDHLKPVAGFCLDVASKIVDKVIVNNSPDSVSSKTPLMRHKNPKAH
ncbi:hypothetical protein SFSGTM_13070 [Sulfuriferula nivalis]|uniref:Uncharacterized protein n=2 Tax=Sulfuriferula nivalis TaxID=2675298 RepID=A0A809RFJ3_9PROT|nr:hypothetical protein SFSGTM_13070 [Sulfuriferula nivalis]